MRGTHGFILEQGHAAIEHDVVASLNGHILPFGFEVGTPPMIVMMLVLVQRAVRVEDVVQHRCIRRYRSLCRRR